MAGKGASRSVHHSQPEAVCYLTSPIQMQVDKHVAAMLLQTAIQARQLSGSTEPLDRQQLVQQVLQQIGAGDTPMIATLKLQVRCCRQARTPQDLIWLKLSSLGSLQALPELGLSVQLLLCCWALL